MKEEVVFVSGIASKLAKLLTVEGNFSKLFIFSCFFPSKNAKCIYF